jgi:hypothetical protein
MRWRIELKVTERGILANGVLLTWSRTMWGKDLRGPSFPGQERVYRRDRTRKELHENYGIQLPRGANLGTRWTVLVDSPLYGVWKDGGTVWDLDEVADFGEDEPDAHVIILGERDEIPVTTESLETE